MLTILADAMETGGASAAGGMLGGITLLLLQMLREKNREPRGTADSGLIDAAIENHGRVIDARLDSIARTLDRHEKNIADAEGRVAEVRDIARDCSILLQHLQQRIGDE